MRKLKIMFAKTILCLSSIFLFLGNHNVNAQLNGKNTMTHKDLVRCVKELNKIYDIYILKNKKKFVTINGKKRLNDHLDAGDNIPHADNELMSGFFSNCKDFYFKAISNYSSVTRALDCKSLCVGLLDRLETCDFKCAPIFIECNEQDTGHMMVLYAIQEKSDLRWFIFDPRCWLENRANTSDRELKDYDSNIEKNPWMLDNNYAVKRPLISCIKEPKLSLSNPMLYVIPEPYINKNAYPKNYKALNIKYPPTKQIPSISNGITTLGLLLQNNKDFKNEKNIFLSDKDVKKVIEKHKKKAQDSLSDQEIKILFNFPCKKIVVKE